jgi:hypothetical protein
MFLHGYRFKSYMTKHGDTSEFDSVALGGRHFKTTRAFCSPLSDATQPSRIR